MTTVLTRTNEKEDLDLKQIKKVLAFATQGLNVNPLELEQRFHLELKPVITTIEIQDALINKASSMAFEDAQWDLVASRLLLWNLYKKYHIATNRSPYENYCNDILDLYNDGKLSKFFVDNYSMLELKEAGTWINQDYDLSLPYSGTLLLSERSLLSEKELPQTAFLSCALLLALNETDKMAFAKTLYHAIASRKISLATPIINSLRSKLHTSLTSCFISMLDDNIDSIFDEVKNTALISKNGGGVGLNFSKIRSTGSDLMGVNNASKGVTPWCKIFNDTVVAVNQGGKRSGAATVALDIWHSDIIPFLDMANEHGDQRGKAYDLFPQVVILDLFMKRIPNNELWTLFCPHEVKTHYDIDLPSLYGEDFEKAYLFLENETEINPFGMCTKRIHAKELFAVIMRNALQRGTPYLFFKDTVNRANPNKHEGYIPNGNLCVESFSNVESGKYIHCCNLVSLNLANIENDEISSLANLAVRLLDNTIDLTVPPVVEAKAHNDRYRTIGVGVMGLADWLAKRDLKYQNLNEISELIEFISYHCVKTSMELAKERGAYPAFNGSDWSKGLFNGYTATQLTEIGKLDWVSLLDEVKLYGIRNSHLMAIAPNTSSSLIQGCTASVLPLFNKNFIYKSGIRTIPIVPPFDSEKYQLNIKLRQEIVVEAISTIQKWIDTGISMELIFNGNENAYQDGQTLQFPKDIFKVYYLAWLKGCKTVYYTRSVQTASKQPECDCAN